MIEPSLTSWRDQYERMRRSFDRTTQPYRSSVEYGDALQHFFQDCFHLKDWIRADSSVNVLTDVEQEFKKEKPLRIAADLANAAKHLVRTMHDREGAYVTSTSVTVHLGQDRPADIEFIVTLADNSSMHAQVLAGEAMASWEAVLARLGIRP